PRLSLVPICQEAQRASYHNLLLTISPLDRLQRYRSSLFWIIFPPCTFQIARPSQRECLQGCSKLFCILRLAKPSRLYASLTEVHPDICHGIRQGLSSLHLGIVAEVVDRRIVPEPLPRQ